MCVCVYVCVLLMCKLLNVMYIYMCVCVYVCMCTNCL